MSRSATAKLYRSFVGGLRTEAGFLTYPENASSDELNTVLNRKGNRTRRLGIDLDEDASPFNTPYTDDIQENEFFWKAPGNKSELNFLCRKIGDALFIFDPSAETSTAGYKFSFDLNPFRAPLVTTDQVVTALVQMTSGNGFLFSVSEVLEPIVIEYHPDTGGFDVTRVLVQTRDFNGVADGLPNDAQPSTLSKEHQYNLMNQGWVSPGSTGGSGQYIDPWSGDVIYANGVYA